jgi:AbrB family looped-hinge helix DNA binding protein
MGKNKLIGVAVVGADGQIVIPEEARRELGIEEGSRVAVALSGKSKKTLVMVHTPELDSLMDSFGIAGGALATVR